MAFMVNVKPTGVEVAFEVGSLKEACDVLQTEANALTELMSIKVNTTEAAPPTASNRKPRGKNQPDPATASAPPPAPVPGNTAPPTPTPPPLVASPPPPLAPAPPPVSGLAKKVATEVQRRHAAAVDGGKVMMDWLYSTGLVIKGATIEEALDVIELQPEDKLRPIAVALNIA